MESGGAERARPVAAILDERPLTALQFRVVILCALVALFDGFDIQAISFAAPAISREWGIPAENFGLIFSTGIMGMIGGLLLQGPIADKVGRRPLIIVSVATFGAASLLTAFTGNITELVITRVVAGLGMGAALPNVIALTGEFSPARLRARLIVIMNAGLPIGGFLGGLISGPLIQQFGWQSIFLVGGAGPLILLVMLILLLPESPPFLATRNSPAAKRRLSDLLDVLSIKAGEAALEPAKREEGFSLALLFRSGRARNTSLLWVVFFANMLLFYFLVGWLPTLLTEAGLPITRAVLVLAGLNLGTVLGGFVLGYFADKVGTGRTLFVTYACSVVLFAALGLGGSLEFAMLALLGGLLGICIGGAQLLLNAMASELYPTEMRSSGVGAAGMSGRVGAVTGPIVGGLLVAQGVGINTLYLLLVVPAVLAGVSVLGMRSGDAAGKRSGEAAPA